MAKPENTATKPVKAPKAEKPKVERPKRQAYALSDAAASIRNSEGRLTGNPWDNGYDEKTHFGPKRGEFASESDFLEFKASTLDRRAQAMVENAAKTREQAAEMRKYGDPAQRAKVRRRQRLLDQLTALNEQLKAEGILVD